MAQLTEELVAKFIDQMAGFQSELQAIKTTQQSNADQLSSQVAKEISQAVGSLQSEFASRNLVIDKDADSVKSDERMRATAGRGDSYLEYKTNVNDFDVAADLRSQDKDIRSHKADLNHATVKLLNISLDNYATVLSNERKYTTSKWQQELRHADIATENQWEDPNEIAGNALSGEIAKSVQVPPAATEG
jgi:hypothetical protein